MTANRSFLVWMIIVFYGISAFWTLGAFFLASAGIIWMDEAADAFWGNLSAWEMMLTIGQSLLTIGAVVALYSLKAVAFRLFVVIWLVDSFEYFRLAWFSPFFLKELDLPSGSILLMSYCIITWVVYFTYRLKTTRILID